MKAVVGTEILVSERHSTLRHTPKCSNFLYAIDSDVLRDRRLSLSYPFLPLISRDITDLLWQ